MGSRHGFNEYVSMSVGSHQVCVYAINDGAGGNPLIVCSTVKVTSPVDQGRVPKGFVEGIVPGAGGATVT
ncbi:hypothetical protein, partial [Microbacterium sp. K19]|uniref:hypothetical protein n=1 Tax=Microbacterium sp. K19 TaxID=2305449 RepID=UPI00197BDC19